jgi:hypothetical protein
MIVMISEILTFKLLILEYVLRHNGSEYVVITVSGWSLFNAKACQLIHQVYLAKELIDDSSSNVKSVAAK